MVEDTYETDSGLVTGVDCGPGPICPGPDKAEEVEDDAEAGISFLVALGVIFSDALVTGGTATFGAGVLG